MNAKKDQCVLLMVVQESLEDWKSVLIISGGVYVVEDLV